MFKSKTGKFLLDHELSFLIFKGNYIDLTKEADINARLMHIKMDMPGQGEDLCINAVRTFYNFLMSAATLIDHYRVVVQAPSFPQPFKTLYNTQVISYFGNDLLAATVKKLRNFTTHKSLTSTFIEGEGFGSYRLFIDIKDLRNWNGWSQSESLYLSTLQDKEDAINFVKPYFNKMEQFYRWFMHEYCKYYPEEAKDLDLLYEKI